MDSVQIIMQDRIDEALDNSSEAEADNLQPRLPVLDVEHPRAKESPGTNPRRNSEDQKTVKMEMGMTRTRDARTSGQEDMGQMQGPTVTLRSKLNLQPRKKMPVEPVTQTNRNLPKEHQEGKSEEVRSALREFELHSLKSKDKPSHSPFNIDHSVRSSETELTARQRDIPLEAKPKEVQVFEEVETGYSFWGFMCSSSISVWKKIGNLLFLILFALSLAMAVVDLAAYSKSECNLGLLTTILYYIYFSISALLKLAMYIFTQLEFHGKIIYSWRVGWAY